MLEVSFIGLIFIMQISSVTSNTASKFVKEYKRKCKWIQITFRYALALERARVKTLLL